MINKDNFMKNVQLYTVSSIILVCLLFFASCADVLDPVKNSDEDGYGRIVVRITGEEPIQNEARTILPPTAFEKYVFIFTKVGEETGVEIIPENDGCFLLEIGSYTVTVMAYNNDILVANGVSSQFSVSSGNNSPVAVNLTSVNSSEKGYFNYTIIYPTGSVADITLQKWPLQEEIVLNPINSTDGNGIDETLELQYGSYILTVLITKSGLYAGLSEAIHINSSSTTIYVKQFFDEDFLTARTPLTSDYNITGIGEFIYDGTVRNISISPKAISSPGDITILYNGVETEPVNAREYIVTLNIAGTQSWTAVNGLAVGTIKINKASSFITWPSLITASLGQTLAQVPITGGNSSIPGTFAWTTPNTPVGFIGLHMHNMTFTPIENNYETLTSMVDVIVTKRVFHITNTDEWNNAITFIRNMGNGTATNPHIYDLNIAGNIPIEGTATETFGTVRYISVTINGSGTISLSSNGNLIRVGANQTFIIDSNNLVLNGKTDNNQALLYLNASTAQMDLKNGIITNNHNNSGSGGGVYLYNGIFNMTGGILSNNSASSSGGGVYSSYMLNFSTFNMTGGEISGNSAGSNGGGVYTYYSTFTMTGGVIKNNDAASGGGIYINFLGTLNMSGGTITSNTATDRGGGVYLANGTFNLLGNALVSNNNAATYGGGINITGGTFIMDGDTVISDNSIINGGGGGICVSGGNMTLQGNASVTKNTSKYAGGILGFSSYIAHMRDNASVSANTASSGSGGGIYISLDTNSTGGTFTMHDNTTVSGNSGTDGGGIIVYGGDFIMNGGTIYGTSATPTTLRNTDTSIVYVRGTAKYGNGTNIFPNHTSYSYSMNTITGIRGNISYTITANGNTNTTTNQLTLTFSEDPVGLTINDITLGGNIVKGSATLSGSGTTRTISGFTVSSSGNATVLINKNGIDSGTKNVQIYWVQRPLTTIDEIIAFIQADPGGTRADPVKLLVNIPLGNISDKNTPPISGWGSLLMAINNTSNKYISLDLSSCSMSGTTFSPGPNAAGGNIVSIILPDAVTSVGGFNRDSNLVGYTFRELTSITGKNVTAINNQAFLGLNNLKEVNFPKATEIGAYAFQKCSSLTIVSFPEVTRIGVGAFYSCTNLTEAHFPKVTHIQSSASWTTDSYLGNIMGSTFGDCPNLFRVTLGSMTESTFENNNYIPTFTGNLREVYFATGGGAGLYIKISTGTSYSWSKWTPPSTTLTRGIRANGNLSANSSQQWFVAGQWFSFTANASTHTTRYYNTSDLGYVNLTLFDSKGNRVGSADLQTWNNNTTKQWNVTNDETYYLYIQDSGSPSPGGTFQIDYQ